MHLDKIGTVVGTRTHTHLYNVKSEMSMLYKYF